MERIERYRDQLRIPVSLESDAVEDPTQYLDRTYPLVSWNGFDTHLDSHVTLYVNATYQAAQEQGR